MTAKEYLKDLLRDEFLSVADPNTLAALSAFADRMHNGVEGYTLDSLNTLFMESGIGDEYFIKTCTNFVSNATAYLQYRELIPSDITD